jgi:signal transduction histidine kinase
VPFGDGASEGIDGKDSAQDAHELDLLARAIPGLLYRASLTGQTKTEFFGGNVLAMTGFATDELLSGGPLPIEHLMTPSDRDRRRAEILEAATCHQPFTIEYAIRHRSGALRRFVEYGILLSRPGAATPRIGGLILDVSDRRTLEHRLRESEDVRRDLSSQLLTSLETERRRVAAELHDGLGQMLTSIKMRVEATLPFIKGGQTTNAEEMLGKIVPMIQGTMDEVRSISMALRPSILDDLGIIATIGWFCRNFASTCPGIRVEQDVRIKERDVPQDLKIVIYRVLQEAMNNVAKHAHAQFVRVRLARLGADIELVVEDNGRGFDATRAAAQDKGEPGVGIANMRQRLDTVRGKLSIRSTARVGTIVRATFPCDSEPLNRW